MKSYKEMSASVIKRINEHKEKQKERKEKIKKATLAVTGLCVVVLIFVGVWQTGIFGENDKYETVVKITGKDSKASKHVVAEENTRRTTATKKTTTKSTTKKNTITEKTTTKEDYLNEESLATITTTMVYLYPYGTNKSHPEEFPSAESAIYYSDGKKGEYEKSYLDEIIAILNRYINDGTVEKVNTQVTKETISDIRANETAISINFYIHSEGNYREIRTEFNDGTSRTQLFEEVLLILEGKNAGYMYFIRDGECSWGEPIKITNIGCLNAISEIKLPKMHENNLISNWVK